MSESIGYLVAMLLGLTVLGLLPGWVLGNDRGHRRMSRQSARLPVARAAPPRPPSSYLVRERGSYDLERGTMLGLVGNASQPGSRPGGRR